MKHIFLALALCLGVGCSTVTIEPKGLLIDDGQPTYQKSLPFFLAGVIGERTVDAKQICEGRGVRQIQTQNTFLDSFLGIVTITIYSPRTVKIWCVEKGA